MIVGFFLCRHSEGGVEAFTALAFVAGFTVMSLLDWRDERRESDRPHGS